jgi:predicted phage terminase large subunit-like protein
MEHLDLDEHLQVISAGLEHYTTRELLDLDAQLGLDDLYHFNTNILRFGRDLPDGTFFQMPEGEVRPLANFLNTPRPAHLRPTDRRKRILTIPRGTTKTSLGQGYVGQQILRNPDLAVLWTSELKALANRTVGDLANRLDSEAVRLRYGQLRGATDWTLDHFTLATRKKDRKEPTVMTGGIDVPIQGWHYDLIICDDLQGLSNSTPEGIEKVAQYLNLLWPVLNPGGELLWICTRWDYDDVASRILKEARENPLSWETLPTARGYLGATAVEGDDDFFRDYKGNSHVVVGDPQKGVNFPSVLDAKVLAELRKDPPIGMGLYQYSCQYENNPLPTEAATFNPNDFRHVNDWVPLDELDLEHPAYELFSGLDYYMAVDFASGDDEVKYGDDTSIAVIGVRGLDIQREVYVVESDGGKWKPDETADKMFLLNDKWRPRLIGIETNAMQKTMKWVINDRMRGQGIYLPLRELKRSGRKAKSDEIRKLQPYYTAHSIFHFRSLKGGKLEEQLIRFKPGSSIHDDYPDALAMAFQLVREGYQVARQRANSRTQTLRRLRLRGRGSTVGAW